MKKSIGLLILCAMILNGCGQQNTAPQEDTAEEKMMEETGITSDADEGLSGKETLETEEPVRETAGTQEDAGVMEDTNMKEQTLTLTVGGQEFTAAVEDNETTKTFLAMLPLSLTMNDFNGNEKVISLPESIRKEDSSCPGTIYSGDIMCYGSNQLVIFYDTFSTVYRYVKIGHIEDVEGYEAALGSGSAEVAFSLK